MYRFPHTVTFKAPTVVRSASGAVSQTWAAAAGLSDLPALVIPAIAEDETERMVLTSDLYQIIVQGDRAVSTDMAAVSNYAAGTFNVIRVVRPIAPMPQATIVTARLVSL